MDPTNLTGETFFNWTVVEKTTTKTSEGRYYYKCRCACGTEREVVGRRLVRGLSMSCGHCVYRANRAKRTKRTPCSTRLKQYKKGANNRKYSWNISNERAFELFQRPCAYCAAPASAEHPGGIDRLDNTRGYEPDNVAACCRICNRAKSDLSVEDFVAWIKRFAFTVTTKPLDI